MYAQLQAASFSYAQLQGALLDGAQLHGASLVGAELQDAWLDDAQLQGASLDHAQLQGASLNGAQLQGASFVDVCVWRADARQAVWEETRVVHPGIMECDWTAASFAAFKQLIAVKVAEGFFIRLVERSSNASIQRRPWKARTRWRSFGPLAKAIPPLQRPMRRASPSNGASWAAPRRERPTCFKN